MIPVAVDARTVRDAWNVPDVANGGSDQYNGDMPRQKDPNEVSAAEAIRFLSTYKRAFYELVEQGRIKQHWRPIAKRPYYLKSELEAFLAEEEARLNMRKQGAD